MFTNKHPKWLLACVFIGMLGLAGLLFTFFVDFIDKETQLISGVLSFIMMMFNAPVIAYLDWTQRKRNEQRNKGCE